MAPFPHLRKRAKLLTSTLKHPSSTSTPGPSLKSIERQTNQPLTLQTEPTIGNLATCNPQFQSPLYQLPQELRDIIFAYATQPHADAANIYDPTSFYYRPGLEAKSLASTGLPRTCRRAWLELNHLPPREAEHVFWLKDGARVRPPWCRSILSSSASEEARLQKFLARLTPLGRARLRHIRVFGHTDSSWLEAGSKGLVKVLALLSAHPTTTADVVGPSSFAPQIFTLTIRHCDWPRLPCNRQLADVRIEPRWLVFLVKSLSAIGVAEFRLEMETLLSDGELLDAVVEEVRGAEVAAAEGKLGAVLPLCGGSVEEGMRLELLEGSAEMEWTRARQGVEGDGRGGEGLMERHYRVVTLLWKRRVACRGEQQAAVKTKPCATSDIAARYEERWKKEGSLLRFHRQA